MKKNLTHNFITIAVALVAANLFLFTGCESSSKAEAPVEIPFEKEYKLCDLAKKYGFKVGTCVTYATAGHLDYCNLLANDFNTVTACNEFKAYSLLSQSKSEKNNKLTLDFTQADFIAKSAQELGIGIRGHVLVWDAYMSDWFFRDEFRRNGDFVSKEVMEERLLDYITQVVTHFETKFPGLVYCWDVVNEAVADSDGEAVKGNPYRIRKTRGGTPNLFYQTMGEDYVKYSFQCARKVVTDLNADIKLFYNDYNTFYEQKRDKIYDLIAYLNKEEKLCDGIGMQGYIGGYGHQDGCMNPYDLTLIEIAINRYKKLNIEVQLTEVAVRNYNGDEDSMNAHAKFYGKLFEVLKDINSDGKNLFTGITIWGISDNPTMDTSDYSYKQNGPFCGLYKKDLKIKDSYKEVYSVLKE